MAAGTGTVADLATLHTLDESGLQSELKERFKKDIIYTYIGDIIIAMNPYKNIPIYDEDAQQRYRSLSKRDEQPPHIFAISDNVYQNLMLTGQDQCCIVSGESGAGKTESTKYIVKHIAQLSHHSAHSDLHERIVRVNPLLEAFGNAQTVINNNSSRFGKYIELQIDRSGTIKGANISEYLLEKSRVVSQAVGEKNFHIFYYLYAGLEQSQLDDNRLGKADDHRILRPLDGQSIFKSQQDKDHHRDQWKELLELFKGIGFEDLQVEGLLATMAAIIHLTDVNFMEDEKNTEGGVIVTNEESVELAAKLLLVPAEELLKALISNVTMLATGEEVLMLKNMAQANDGRDALAKTLYQRLFAWTVRSINILIKPGGKIVIEKSIGILDLAGFENFQNNSFEQLCINVSNEQLHFYFNQYIFKLELEEYEREGISGANIQFVDNKELIALFVDKPHGLFATLDEQCRVPGPSDRNFVDVVTRNYRGKSCFQRPKGDTLQFVIHHYAGAVIYNVENFIEKNRDTVSKNTTDCMKNSESTFVTEMFHAKMTNRGSMIKKIDAPKRNRASVLFGSNSQYKPPPPGAGSRMSRAVGASIKQQPKYTSGTVGRKSGTSNAARKTVGTDHVESLTSLMEKLKAGEPHFIRCIKPNANKLAEVFQEDLVMTQLRYTGVLETVKIRKQGYATRLPFNVFIERYKFLCFSISDEPEPTADNCQKILKSLALEDYAIGKTKVFLRYYHTEQMQVQIDRFTRKVTRCQNLVRAFLAVQEYRRKQQRAREQAVMLQQASDSIAQLSLRLHEVQVKHAELDRERHRIKLQKEKEERERQEREAELRRKQEDDNKKKKSQIQREQQLAEAREEAERRRRDEEDKRRVDRVTQPPISVVSAPAEDLSPRPEIHIPPPPPGLVSPGQQLLWELLQEALGRYTELSNQIWAKVFYFEKQELVGKVYLRDWEVTVNNSDTKYDGKIIGLRFEQFNNPYRDWESLEVLDQVGPGVQICRDEEGSVLIRNLSNYPLIAKDYTNPQKTCLAPDLVESFGQIPNWPVKIFDMNRFKAHVAEELQKPEINVAFLQMLCMVSFSFMKNCMQDLLTPCWISIINFSALELLGNENVLNELLRMGRTAVSTDKQEVIRRKWAGLYRARRVSTDSMRTSTLPPMLPGATMSVRTHERPNIPSELTGNAPQSNTDDGGTKRKGLAKLFKR